MTENLQAIIAASLRRERTRVGLSLSELAKQANIAKSTLSQLESGNGNPNIETLWALGVALGVPFSRLVEPPSAGVRVIRRGEGPAVAYEGSTSVVSLLHTGMTSGRRDIYLMQFELNKTAHAKAHMAGTVEHIVVASGRLEVGPEAEPVELGPGDYVCYPGDVAHTFRGLEPGTMAVLVDEYL
ncbi:XRE family transcriptional regulator [Pseudonocardiaceae bacterium YIM PH 21723]|nr:XRE family transcriptional regulator [Pseudonocardiaceae bacterium YIM PH 21723]